MSIEKINHWLTLLANIGVLAGIIFLAIELQQNTSISKANGYRENIQGISDWRSDVMSDPGLSEIFRKYYVVQDVSELDGSETTQLFLLILNIFGSYENAYFARDYGVIGDEEWARFEKGVCTHFNITKGLELEIAIAFITDQFRSHLDSVC